MAAEEAVLRTMLFDFYGELLTEKQREYFDLHYNEDLSLAEIAALTGISRQGVWDIIRRAEATLRDIEACRPLPRQARGALGRGGAAFRPALLPGRRGKARCPRGHGRTSGPGRLNGRCHFGF